MEKLYQIVLLGTPFEVNELVKLLNVEYPEIGFVEPNEVNSRYPVLYLYYAQTAADRDVKDSALLSRLCNDCTILPVVKDIRMFNKIVPKEIASINGFELLNTDQLSGLKNFILRYFRLIHGTRKVFISYRRTDTRRLAYALYHNLVDLGYLPFLDTCSIDYGRKFQEELKHELADCEVFVYLNSPHYMESPYTQEELRVAQQLNVGIVQVLVGNVMENKTVVSQEVVRVFCQYLDNCQEIVNAISRKCASSFAFKRKALLDTLRSVKPAGVWKPLLGVYDTGKKMYYVYTAMPHSPIMHEVHQIKNSYGWNDCDVVYNGAFCKASWVDHLDWLNKFLDVKSIDVNVL